MKRQLFFIILLYSTSLLSLDYDLSNQAFHKIKNQTYATMREVKKLFKELGLVYLKTEKIAKFVKDKLPKDQRLTNFYKLDPSGHNMQTKLYGRAIAKKYRGPIQVKWVSDEVGFGVYATDDIQKYDLIQVYTGIIDLKDNISNKDYCWQYCIKTIYDENVSCDAMDEGNEMRFVNHSDHPNTFVDYVYAKGRWHVCYLASRNIKKGDQITVSYGKNYWKTRTKIIL